MTRPFRMKLATKVVHNIKGISNITDHCDRVLAVTETIKKFFRTVGHSIWDVDSTQLELARSV